MITEDFETLRQRFADEWDAGVVTIYDLQPHVSPPKNAPFVRFAVRAGASEHYAGSAANGDKKQLGRVWLQVFAPDQSGDAMALDLIDQFASIYRNWHSTDNVIHCETEEMMGPVPDRETGMMMFTVSIPWISIRSY